MPFAQSARSAPRSPHRAPTATTTAATASALHQRSSAQRPADASTRTAHRPTKGSTLRSASASAPTFAILSPESTPTASATALKHPPVEGTSSSTPLCADASALDPDSAHVARFGAPLPVTALPTQEQSVPPHSISSTQTDATACAKLNHSACAEHQLSTPHAPALLCHRPTHQRSSTQLPVLRDAQVSNHADAASFGVITLAPVCRTQLPDACLIFTDLILLLAIVFVPTRLNANVELNQ